MTQRDPEGNGEYHHKSAKRRYKSSEHILAQGRKYRQNVRREVLGHYSDGTLECRRCGFSDIRALSIDHVEGNGADMRRDTGRGGVAYYRFLKQTGYPAGYQVLCMNCQFIKKEENGEMGVPGRGGDPARKRAHQVFLRQKTKLFGTTEYQGVSRARGKLTPRICKDGKTYWLGLFALDQAEEAAKNYDFHAIALYGRENCFLNFPDFDYSGFVPKRRLPI